MERGKLPGKSYYDLAMDLRSMVYSNYVHFNDKEVKKIANYGRYFPDVVANTSKYIQYQPQLRTTLTRLREAGKRLFLATNSHTEYTELIMS